MRCKPITAVVSSSIFLLSLLFLLMKTSERFEKFEDNKNGGILDTGYDKTTNGRGQTELESVGGSLNKTSRAKKDVAMDLYNPFGQQAAGNRTYTFYDYFDYVDFTDQSSNGAHELAVIVPFRKASPELAKFLPYMERFLDKQNIMHRFFVLDQVDDLRFNRASLVNVGFLEMAKTATCDYIAIHDVDLVPLNPQLSYRFDGCSRGPVHLAPPSLHPVYSKVDFVGAILLMKNEHYVKINGMSNTFWGWGREDEEFRIRIRRAGFKIHRPKNINSTKDDTFAHFHRKNRKRDTAIIGEQLFARFKLDRVTGLSTTQYKLVKKSEEEIQGVSYTHIKVKLECDMILTPWCKA